MTEEQKNTAAKQLVMMAYARLLSAMAQLNAQAVENGNDGLVLCIHYVLRSIHNGDLTDVLDRDPDFFEKSGATKRLMSITGEALKMVQRSVIEDLLPVDTSSIEQSLGTMVRVADALGSLKDGVPAEQVLAQLQEEALTKSLVDAAEAIAKVTNPLYEDFMAQSRVLVDSVEGGE